MQQRPSSSQESSKSTEPQFPVAERLVAELREAHASMHAAGFSESTQENEGHLDATASKLGRLPEENLAEARQAYYMLSESDNINDRYWAALLYPALLVVDKDTALAILDHLIGTEEPEALVRDTAYDVLTEEALERGLLTIEDAAPAIFLYVEALRASRASDEPV